MLGLFAGQLVRSGQSNLRKVLWLVLLGAGCLLAGLFWSGWVASRYPGVRWFGKDWSSWPVWFPIIKNRWTSTFVLFAGGWSFLLLAFFYLVIDVWGFRRWAVPLVAIGMNSIFAYMAWNLFRGAFRTAAEVFLGGLRRHVGPWYETMVWAGAAALLWLLLYWMYRTKTFVKV
jgi:predicted acyltransferase